MKIRPSDGNGDILPVIDLLAMRTGTAAVIEQVKDKLSLLCGDWWENLAWGNMTLDMSCHQEPPPFVRETLMPSEMKYRPRM